MRVLCANIRTGLANDGLNSWVHRKDLCVRVIRSHAPDLFCLQETTASQFQDLRAAFPDFDAYGLFDEPLGRSPRNVIFFRRDRFRPITVGGYFLSETPHVVGSSSWESACVRFANWVRLDDLETGAEFRLLNTHLDHRSQGARERQAERINEDAAAYPDDYPQILTGDMNADRRNRTIQVFVDGGWRDTHETVHGPEDPGRTYHAFQGDASDTKWGKIDWIFVRGAVAVRDAAVIRDAEGGRYPSDHYFISADLRIEPTASDMR